LHAAREERRHDEEQKAERNLRGNQRLANDRSASARPNRSRLRLHRIGQWNPGATEGGTKTGSYSCDQCETERKRQHTPIEGCVEVDG
jgi:hypothetical protein